MEGKGNSWNLACLACYFLLFTLSKRETKRGRRKRGDASIGYRMPASTNTRPCTLKVLISSSVQSCIKRLECVRTQAGYQGCGRDGFLTNTPLQVLRQPCYSLCLPYSFSPNPNAVHFTEYPHLPSWLHLLSGLPQEELSVHFSVTTLPPPRPEVCTISAAAWFLHVSFSPEILSSSGIQALSGLEQ